MKINLKNLIAVWQIFILAVIGIGSVNAQFEEKLNVYVWDFSVSHDSLNRFGTSFTNDFESQLVNLEKYVVLERRRYDRIMAHQDMENQISDIRNISSQSKENLTANKADAVFFGTLIYDGGSGEFELMVMFQDLEGNNLKRANIVFKKGIINDNANRKKIVADLMDELYASEIFAEKKEQFEMINKKLSSYRARVDEISKRYGEVIETLLVDPNPEEYVIELQQKIQDYNEIWNDLNDNKNKYLQEFGTRWGKDHLRDFTDIYSKIMNDFHERFIRRLDEVVIEVNNYRRDQSSSKKEKKDRKKLVISNTKKMTADIKTELNNTIKPQINGFLDNLRNELILE
ncbi:MAG: hypothetical protein KJN76_04925 [Eudoraea sp.]|nr:hypothetical protein [Eudoraea sp.]